MKNYVKYSALVTTIALVAVLEGPANAIPEFAPEAAAVTNTQQLPTVVTTPTPKAKPTPAKPKATTKPAPKKAPAPAPVVPQSVPTPAPEAVQAPVTAPTNIPPVTAPTPVPAPVKVAPEAVKAAPVTPAPAVVPASGKGQAIASAARAQLGVTQDCTRLATNALAAVGINFHGWPAGYLGLGRTVSAAEAQPGDLAYYANGGSGVAHIAVYIGGGQAVHGGWNGNQTSIQSVNVGSGPVFIRVA